MAKMPETRKTRSIKITKQEASDAGATLANKNATKKEKTLAALLLTELKMKKGKRNVGK